MYTESLSILAPAKTIHQDRIAQAEHRRLVSAVLNGRRPIAIERPRPRLIGVRPPRDLGGWLALVGDTVAGHERWQLERKRPALVTVVDELLAAGRAAGLEIALRVDPQDSPAVLTRTLGRLAAASAGTSVPVSGHRRRRLTAALDGFTMGTQAVSPQSLSPCQPEAA